MGRAIAASISLAFACTACSAAGEEPAQSNASASVGFLTITETPPSPFPVTVPADPTLGREDLVDRYARENGLTRAQAEAAINGPPELRAEMERIAERIQRDNPENFVTFVMVRDPAVRMEAWFVRDAAKTLAKYTNSPLFVAREGGLSMATQEELRALWLGRMQGEHGYAFNTMSGQPQTGKLEIGIAIQEADFRALAREEGWELGPQLDLHFAPPRPPAFAHHGIAEQVRVFAREHLMPGGRNEALFVGRIILDDGCFKVEQRDGFPAHLAMFGYGTYLDRDDEGNLLVRSASDRHYRVGEMGAWGGPAGVDETNPEVIALRKACGDGPIMNVTEPTSSRLFSLPFPQWVTNYAKAKGLSRQEAWDEIIVCMKREEKTARIGIDARDKCIRQFN